MSRERDMLRIADALASEKNVDKEIVFVALEAALAAAAKKYFKEEVDIRVSIDRSLGTHETYRRWAVVHEPDLENESLQIGITDARDDDPSVDVGDFIEEEVKDISFGRIEALAAKQMILQKIREAERQQILKDFLARNEKIVHGTVKRVEKNRVIIDLGRIEAVLPADQMIPKEVFRVNDRVRAYIKQVDSEQKMPTIIVSRSAPEFIEALFEIEVPEVEEKIVEIKGVVRELGIRAKVAVHTNDPRVEPIRTCVGIRSSRVQAVTNALGGETIDLVIWDEDPVKYAIGALSPAKITTIMLDENTRSMDVVVDEENMRIAVGRNGQNIRLACKLTGWNINLLSEADSQEKQAQESASTRALFMGQLDVDEDVANILLDEGYTTLEEIAYVPLEEMLSIQSIDAETVNELRERARNRLLIDQIVAEESLLDARKQMSQIPGVSEELVTLLFKQNIKSRDGLADLTADELCDIVPMPIQQAGEIIMAARAHWFAE